MIIFDYCMQELVFPIVQSAVKEINKQTVDQMVDVIMDLSEGTKIQVLAPVVRGRKGEHVKLFEQAKEKRLCACYG